MFYFINPKGSNNTLNYQIIKKYKWVTSETIFLYNNYYHYKLEELMDLEFVLTTMGTILGSLIIIEIITFIYKKIKNNNQKV